MTDAAGLREMIGGLLIIQGLWLIGGAQYMWRCSQNTENMEFLATERNYLGFNIDCNWKRPEMG